MTRNDYIKQAYAYGASIALKEAGVEQDVADETAVKLAYDLEGMHPAVSSLLLEDAPQESKVTKTAGALAQALGLKQ